MAEDDAPEALALVDPPDVEVAASVGVRVAVSVVEPGVEPVVEPVEVGVAQSVPVGVDEDATLVEVFVLEVAVVLVLVLVLGSVAVAVTVGHGVVVSLAGLVLGGVGEVLAEVFGVGSLTGFGLCGMPRGGPGSAGGSITCGGAGLGSVGTTGTVSPGTPLA